MKKTSTLIVLVALSFAACIKTVIPIPPPPGGNGGISATPGNIPYGISMVLNGKYLTFNTNASLDTSNNEVYISGWGDFAGYTNLHLDLGAYKFDNKPVTVGVYPESGDLEENESDFTIYNWGFDQQNYVGFGAYPDTVTIVSITDTSVKGTFNGLAEAKYMDWVNPNIWHDSIMTVTNGQFFLHK